MLNPLIPFTVRGGIWYQGENNRERAKAFSDRHSCPSKKDKLSPGYWSCNLPRYAKELGLKGGGNYFW